jgi:hypothetical protein
MASTSVITEAPPTPRPLRRCRGYAQLIQNHVMLVCLLFFGYLFCMVGVGQVKLYFGSVVLPAEVIGAREEPVANSHVRHFLTVTYRLDGAAHSSELLASSAEVAKFKVGSTVRVTLLPEYPDRAQIYYEHYPRRFVAATGALFALAPVVSILALLWRLYVSPWRLRQLLATGQASAGTIVDKQQRPGRPPRYTITYEYHPRDSAPMRQTMDIHGEDFPQVQLGAAVAVFYDPARPRTSVAYPYADYEFAGATRPENTGAAGVSLLHWLPILLTSAVMVAGILWLCRG